MSDQQPRGFLATPSTGAGPGILVLHAWWGLNATIRAFCSRLAEQGFLVFAPDLYHGKLADTIEDAEVLGSALDENDQQVKAEIAQAAQYLSDHTANSSGAVGVVAFSLGVYYALDLAAAQPELVRAVVIYYGSGDGDYRTSKAAYLGHFAELDPFEPRPNVDALEESLRSAGRPVAFYHYEGCGHWFCEPDRLDAYNRPAAELAWQRTLAFLKQRLTAADQ